MFLTLKGKLSTAVFFRNKERYLLIVSLERNHNNNDKHIGAPCNISSGMFGIRCSYSDNYYATDGEDRGCSATDGSITFNSSQDTSLIKFPISFN